MDVVNEFLVKDKSLSQSVGTPLHAGIKPLGHINYTGLNNDISVKR